MLEKMRMKPFFPENEDPISPNAMLMTARSQLLDAGGFPAPSEHPHFARQQISTQTA